MPAPLPSSPGEKPVLIFDGECNFCRFWVERWRGATGDRVEYRPYQAVAGEFPMIPTKAFQEAVQLVEPDAGEARITSGADAVFRVLAAYGGKRGWLIRLLQRIPGLLPLARWAYRRVATHRSAMGSLTRFFWGTASGPATYFIAKNLFVRLLGLVYFFAFASLLVQIRGLVGSRGILPIQNLLNVAGEQLGPERFHLLPTLFWGNASDTALVGACWAGVFVSLLAMLGWMPGVSLLLAWVLYLSLTVAGQVFLGFQWDALLLETGLLALFLVPPLAHRLPIRWQSLSSQVSRWLLLWLMFRLMFESGVVKLASGDPTWRNLTALAHHYETQPLPLPTAWFAQLLPLWVHKANVVVTFVIELFVPLALFLPRRGRQLGFFALVALQAGIALTGNYGYFNFLSAILCLLMLDDAFWPQWLRRRFGFAPQLGIGSDPARPLPVADTVPVSRSGWPFPIFLPVAALSLLLGGMTFLQSFNRSLSFPEWLDSVANRVAPFRSFNGYGLFAVMTTERPEIVLEGSDDGQTWHAYEFRWKPGDPARMPPIIAPHQPRLDWQMWFAALGSPQQNPWFFHLMVRMLQGEPEVLALLGKNPFPDRPPEHLRAALYRYHFTKPGDGPEWWKREFLGYYASPVSLKP